MNYHRRKMFYCYVLRSEKARRRYVGSCENLADRISRHNAGESKATKHGIPWILSTPSTQIPKKQAFGTNAYTL
jgi:predicted GIY-YIG superfamily endonuclease